MSAEPDPLAFVGGTGRSGTHVIGRLIGSGRLYADVPIEARMHSSRLGLTDLLAGESDLETFLAKLRGFWWHRVRVDGQPRGLYNLLTREQFDAACERFERAYAEAPADAARALFTDLLGGVRERAGKPGLVEMSSHNLRVAGRLGELFPGARFIHAVRDGRDSAASVTSKTWGPGRIGSAIGWWAERLRAIDAGVRELRDHDSRLHVVVLDELTGSGRDEQFAALCRFTHGEAEEPGMRAYLDAAVRPDSAHHGRWAEGRGRLAQAVVRRRYERALRELARERNHAAPALAAAYERSRG